MPRLVCTFPVLFACVFSLSAQSTEVPLFEYAPTRVLAGVNGIADLQPFGGVDKVFARATRTEGPDVHSVMFVWRGDIAGSVQVTRKGNQLYWSDSSPESNISRILISDHWSVGSRHTTLTWSPQDMHWHGEQKFYGKRAGAPDFDYDRVGKAITGAYLIVRNDFIANAAVYRQVQTDKEMAEQRVLAEKAAGEAKAQAEQEARRQAAIEADILAHQAEEKLRLAKLQPLLLRRKAIGDFVCATSGNRLGYVERIEGSRIQIRVRRMEYDMIWKPYNTVYVCDSGD